MYAGKLLIYSGRKVEEEYMGPPDRDVVLLAARNWVFVRATGHVAIQLKTVECSADAKDFIFRKALRTYLALFEEPSGCKWERITQVTISETLDELVILTE